MLGVPAPDPLLVGLGDAIRSLRDERGISQERLSLESGIHRNYIGGIERAERRSTLTTVAVIATTLGLRPSEPLALAESLGDRAPTYTCRARGEIKTPPRARYGLPWRWSAFGWTARERRRLP